MAPSFFQNNYSTLANTVFCQLVFSIIDLVVEHNSSKTLLLYVANTFHAHIFSVIDLVEKGLLSKTLLLNAANTFHARFILLNKVTKMLYFKLL